MKQTCSVNFFFRNFPTWEEKKRIFAQQKIQSTYNRMKTMITDLYYIKCTTLSCFELWTSPNQLESCTMTLIMTRLFSGVDRQLIDRTCCAVIYCRSWLDPSLTTHCVALTGYRWHRAGVSVRVWVWTWTSCCVSYCPHSPASQRTGSLSGSCRAHHRRPQRRTGWSGSF